MRNFILIFKHEKDGETSCEINGGSVVREGVLVDRPGWASESIW